MATCTKNVFFTVALTLVVGLLTAAQVRGVSIPIDVTGWDKDVIAENTAVSPIAGTSSDYTNGTSSWVWYEIGAPNSTQGLPSSGSFVSLFDPTVTFQFEPYTSNNAVNTTTTLTLSTPSKVDSLAFLVSGSGGSWSPTLNFSDSSSTVLGPSFFSNPNWTTAGGDNARNFVGLSNRVATWTSFFTNDLHLFHNAYTLTPTDQAKTLESITFTLNSGNQVLFAISGEVNAPPPVDPVPEPGTLGLLAVGMLLLPVARRRRRA